MRTEYTVEELQNIMFTKKKKVHKAFKVMTEILEAECAFDDSPQFNFFEEHEDFLHTVSMQFWTEIDDEYQHKILFRAVDKLFDKA